MIYTVFPLNDDSELPQDFATRKEAEEYKAYIENSFGIECQIQSTNGEVV